MKTKLNQSVDQPSPFTPVISKTIVRDHALKLYREKLRHSGHLTLADWVLAEKDLLVPAGYQGAARAVTALPETERGSDKTPAERLSPGRVGPLGF